jgi:hypothetical protein
MVPLREGNGLSIVPHLLYVCSSQASRSKIDPQKSLRGSQTHFGKVLPEGGNDPDQRRASMCRLPPARKMECNLMILPLRIVAATSRLGEEPTLDSQVPHARSSWIVQQPFPSQKKSRNMGRAADVATKRKVRDYQQHPTIESMQPLLFRC